VLIGSELCVLCSIISISSDEKELNTLIELLGTKIQSIS
jgi:hypothetical protein